VDRVATLTLTVLTSHLFGPLKDSIQEDTIMQIMRQQNIVPLMLRIKRNFHQAGICALVPRRKKTVHEDGHDIKKR
jgi:hypothetical protein